MNKYIKYNLKLYEANKEHIKEGWWGWHGLITRFKCVECGTLLKGSDYLTSYIRREGLEACKKIVCWDCHQSIKLNEKNGK